jgi:hypothetical protein
MYRLEYMQFLELAPIRACVQERTRPDKVIRDFFSQRRWSSRSFAPPNHGSTRTQTPLSARLFLTGSPYSLAPIDLLCFKILSKIVMRQAQILRHAILVGALLTVVTLSPCAQGGESFCASPSPQEPMRFPRCLESKYTIARTRSSSAL